MTLRPDIAACWLYRIPVPGDLEILLIRRSTAGTYPGLWQCVTGKIEPGEPILDAALREVAEEAGLISEDLEAVLETDIVNTFHEVKLDALLVEAVFAARVRPGAVVRLSGEHDDARWLSPDAARELVVWPAYLRAIEFLEWLVAKPELESTFRLR
ncbi:MAG: NUDIX domain-containing protein [Candidatus Limnocylindrales bacterium]